MRKLTQKNQEILEKWRKFGFLKGLKEGSINEWRCAKSFENMAEWIMKNPSESNYALTTLSFPLIRRALCTGKDRLYRIIDAESIVECFRDDTVRKCFEHIDEERPSKVKRIKPLLESFITLIDAWEMPIGEFISIIANPNESDNPLMKSVCILNSIMDVEVELMYLVTAQFETYFVDNVWEGIEIGDEFEVDGERE